MATPRKPSATASGPAAGYERVGPYEIKEEIGRGSFAIVYYGEKLVRGLPHLTRPLSVLAQTTTPPTPVAIKVVMRNKLTPKLSENLESEIRLLTGMKHGNIVELVDCVVRRTVVSMEPPVTDARTSCRRPRRITTSSWPFAPRATSRNTSSVAASAPPWLATLRHPLRTTTSVFRIRAKVA